MLELLRRYADAIAGFGEVSRERTEKLVADLQHRGEVRAQDVRRVTEQIVERSNRNRRELMSLVQKEIRRQIHALGLATRDDVDKLAKRVKALESGARAKPAAKRTTTTRRPAAKAR